MACRIEQALGGVRELLIETYPLVGPDGAEPMRDFSKTPQYKAIPAKLNAKRRHEDERRAEARELYSDDQGG